MGRRLKSFMACLSISLVLVFVFVTIKKGAKPSNGSSVPYATLRPPNRQVVTKMPITVQKSNVNDISLRKSGRKSRIKKPPTVRSTQMRVPTRTVTITTAIQTHATDTAPSKGGHLIDDEHLHTSPDSHNIMHARSTAPFLVTTDRLQDGQRLAPVVSIEKSDNFKETPPSNKSHAWQFPVAQCVKQVQPWRRYKPQWSQPTLTHNYTVTCANWAQLRLGHILHDSNGSTTYRAAFGSETVLAKVFYNKQVLPDSIFAALNTKRPQVKQVIEGGASIAERKAATQRLLDESRVSMQSEAQLEVVMQDQWPSLLGMPRLFGVCFNENRTLFGTISEEVIPLSMVCEGDVFMDLEQRLMLVAEGFDTLARLLYRETDSGERVPHWVWNFNLDALGTTRDFKKFIFMRPMDIEPRGCVSLEGDPHIVAACEDEGVVDRLCKTHWHVYNETEGFGTSLPPMLDFVCDFHSHQCPIIDYRTLSGVYCWKVVQPLLRSCGLISPKLQLVNLHHRLNLFLKHCTTSSPVQRLILGKAAAELRGIVEWMRVKNFRALFNESHILRSEEYARTHGDGDVVPDKATVDRFQWYHDAAAKEKLPMHVIETTTTSTTSSSSSSTSSSTTQPPVAHTAMQAVTTNTLGESWYANEQMVEQPNLEELQDETRESLRWDAVRRHHMFNWTQDRINQRLNNEGKEAPQDDASGVFDSWKARVNGQDAVANEAAIEQRIHVHAKQKSTTSTTTTTSSSTSTTTAVPVAAVGAALQRPAGATVAFRTTTEHEFIDGGTSTLTIPNNWKTYPPTKMPPPPPRRVSTTTTVVGSVETTVGTHSDTAITSEPILDGNVIRTTTAPPHLEVEKPIA